MKNCPEHAVRLVQKTEHRENIMAARPPARDWATDFDHTDPRWNNDPYPIWDELRKRCPVAHTERFRGAYFPSRFQDVRDIAYDTEHFSSRRVIVREERMEPPPPSPPITSDPPEHRPARMPLLPAFNPKAVERLTPRTRELCNELIDRFVSAAAATRPSTTRSTSRRGSSRTCSACPRRTATSSAPGSGCRSRKASTTTTRRCGHSAK